MSLTIRTSLVGNDSLTDTNKDHYSLYADQDNVLIKEKQRGTLTLGTAVGTIAHNLGYIPDFKAYVNDQSSLFGRNGWKTIPAQNSAFVVANYWAEADTTNLYISNNSGTNTNFSYYLFYDNQVGTASGSISPTSQSIRVSKVGKDAITSNNPNDYIYHSDLNTFKILKQGTASINYTSDGVYTINHGLSLSNESAFDLFIKFPDGYTIKCAGDAFVSSRDQNFNASDAILTTSQIKVYIERNGGSGTIITGSYYIYESPLTGTTGISINQGDNLMRVSKNSYDGLTETDPNNYQFLSGYNTLKYLPSGAGSAAITINGAGTTTLLTTEGTIAHGLGYVPHYTCFVDDFINFPNQRFALAPFSSNALTITRKSEVYIDDTNLYVKMFNKSASNYTGRFYWKIYQNDLGL